jgi:deoxyribose-phosphate aldolase
MQIELACIDRTSKLDLILETIFLGSSERVSCVALPSGFFGLVSSDLKDHATFSSVVDFPYGISDTSVRLHEIILSVRRSVSIIDLVLNPHHIVNNDWKSTRKDIKACLAACKSNKVELRPVVEYRLFEQETIIETCRMLYDLGVLSIVTSTGSMVDDILDNAIISHQIASKSGLSVTSCSNISTPEQVSIFKHAGVQGIRIPSLKTAQLLLDNGV